MPSKNAAHVHDFCRCLYKRVMEEVREHFTAEEIKASWVWDSGGRKE